MKNLMDLLSIDGFGCSMYNIRIQQSIKSKNANSSVD